MFTLCEQLNPSCGSSQVLISCAMSVISGFDSKKWGKLVYKPPAPARGYKPYAATVTEIDTRFKRDGYTRRRHRKKISCTNTFSSAEIVKKLCLKRSLEYIKVFDSKYYRSVSKLKKHCLKGDKLGNVPICISYQFPLKNRSFLQNFTRLHLATQTFYLRLLRDKDMT